MVKKMTFIVKGDGSVELSVDGIQGSGCAKMSAAFEEALGEVVKREKKGAYYLSDNEDKSNEEDVSFQGS